MDCWVKQLWSFVHLVGIQLISETPLVPPFQRQGNACIIDWEVLHNLTSQDLAAFNHCRLVHKVLFLSDIMDGGGHLLRDLLLLPPKSPPPSHWHWPWAVTVKTDWVIWQCFLPQLAVNTALGPWLQAPHLHAFIPFDPVTNSAYVAQPGPFWQIYCPINPHSAHRLQTFFQFLLVLELPASYSFACTHHWSGKNLVLVGHQPFQPIALPQPSPTLLWTHPPKSTTYYLRPFGTHQQLGLAMAPTCHASTPLWHQRHGFSPMPLPQLHQIFRSLYGLRAAFGHQCLLSRTTGYLCLISGS